MSEGLLSADAGAADVATGEAADTAAATANGTAPAPTPNGSAPTDASAVDPNGHGNAWWHGFADGLDKSESLSWRNTASRYTTPQEFVKSHIELRKSFDNRIPVPPQDAKPEDWGKVYDKLGRPAKPEEYKFADKFVDFELDETDKTYRDGMRPVLHRVGLNQWQVNELEKAQVEQIKLARDSQIANRSRAVETAQKSLKAEWTSDFDRNIKMANTTLATYGRDDAKNLAALTLSDGSTLGANPAFIKMLARIGSERAEDDREPSAFNANMRESAQAEIDRLKQESIAKGLSPADPGWPHAQMDALYKKVHGSKNQFTPYQG